MLQFNLDLRMTKRDKFGSSLRKAQQTGLKSFFKHQEIKLKTIFSALNGKE